MAKNLVIVESPAKAKTIEKFLGKDYVVRSSYGHVRDLPSKNISVDVENNFEPQYVIPEDKKKLIEELKKLSKEAETIWLATDEDREGEAISWHLKEALDLDDQRVKRIVFHEITKPAIQKAIQQPRQVNNELVNAQQARRVLDRLVGYELSPVLWRKVQPKLSAGRVQSVAVRLIVEREREINRFESTPTYRVTARFQPEDSLNGKQAFAASLPQNLPDADSARTFLQRCRDAAFSVADVQVKPGKRKPAPPFTTSTLQQEASRKLSFSVKQTMAMAQKLYENGFITYMRTDSLNLSELAIEAAKEEIGKRYGVSYSQPRRYSTKDASAQEAHEAIRPTDMSAPEVKIQDTKAYKLYQLIWKRTIASQMAEAELEKTTIKIALSNDERQFKATGEVIKFDGFLKVYLESTDEDEEQQEEKEEDGLLPRLTKGDKVDLLKAVARERYSRPPSRYTEASLVKKLEELGIGRPSTYAPTISTIQARKYVTKEERPGKVRDVNILELPGSGQKITERKEEERYGVEKNKLFPNSIGMVVNDFLLDHFVSVMDYEFTAKVEKEFDEIAHGNKSWQEMLSEFYYPFHKTVEKTQEESGKVKGERHLGEDPVSGKPIYAKIGKYGPFLQVGETESEEKPKFSKLPAEKLIETVTYEEALEYIRLPREVTEFEGQPVHADLGRFGPYLKHNGQFYSIPDGEDPLEVSPDRAREIVVEKRAEKARRHIKTLECEGKTVEVKRGPYGPYMSVDKKNVKIPKDADPEAITAEEAMELIKNHKPRGRGGAKKSGKNGNSKK